MDREAVRHRLAAVGRVGVPGPVYAGVFAVVAATRRTPRADRIGGLGQVDPPSRARQAEVIRDVVGNPFRRVRFDPRWRTRDAVNLAVSAYADRSFERLPILADALQDAGCETPAILDHCRDATRSHVRGCWVLDRVLELG